MSEIPMAHYWMGRPITELSREELIEALIWTADRLAQHQTPEAIKQRVYGQVEMIRRGECR